MSVPNIVNMEYGSNLYGTATPQSDTDYAGIYMPSLEDLLLQRAKTASSKSTGQDHQKNTAEDVDVALFSLPQFVDMCLRGDTTALDMLHCKNPITESEVFRFLRHNRTKFYCKNMKAYVGYVKSQAHKYGLKGDKLAELKSVITFFESFGNSSLTKLSSSWCWQRLPEGEYIKKVIDKGGNYYEVLGKKYQDTNTIGYVKSQLQQKWDSYGHRANQALTNDGMDWKALHHALRVAYQVDAILKDGDFEYPLPQTPFLMKVKRGEASYGDEIAPELDRLLDDITKMSEESKLPNKPDVEFWENWLVDTYAGWFSVTWLEN